MPLGKYYCDYCEKEFQNTQIARKRHLQSKPHLRAKSLWYSSSSPSDPQVSSFAPKGLCNRFVTTNFCPFGDSCRYLHPGFTDITQSHAGFVNQHSQGTSLNRTSWFDLPPSLKPPPISSAPRRRLGIELVFILLPML